MGDTEQLSDNREPRTESEAPRGEPQSLVGVCESLEFRQIAGSENGGILN